MKTLFDYSQSSADGAMARTKAGFLIPLVYTWIPGLCSKNPLRCSKDPLRIYKYNQNHRLTKDNTIIAWRYNVQQGRASSYFLHILCHNILSSSQSCSFFTEQYYITIQQQVRGLTGGVLMIEPGPLDHRVSRGGVAHWYIPLVLEHWLIRAGGRKDHTVNSFHKNLQIII